MVAPGSRADSEAVSGGTQNRAWCNAPSANVRPFRCAIRCLASALRSISALPCPLLLMAAYALPLVKAAIVAIPWFLSSVGGD